MGPNSCRIFVLHVFFLNFHWLVEMTLKCLLEQQGESSNLDYHVQRLTSRMHRGTVSSEESAPGCVTGEPPAPLPRCDKQQEKSPGGTQKLRGLTAQNIWVIWDAREKHLWLYKMMGCSWEGLKEGGLRRNKYGKIKGWDKGSGQLETSGWSVCLTVSWARLPQPLPFSH